MRLSDLVASNLSYACAACALIACTSTSSKNSNPASCTSTGETSNSQRVDAGTLRAFSSPEDPGPNGIWFSASGEVLALGGYAFPPSTADSVAFVDGWEVRFSELLVTLDNIRLSQNPDTNAGDESQMGPEVAKVTGPWAIDLHKGGPLEGKGGSDEQAVPIAALTGHNENNCEPFDLTQKYAVGFDVVQASESAMNVNLDDQALADYAEMVSKGYAVLYVGTATFKGSSCTPTDPEFTKPPLAAAAGSGVVNFRLGFKSPTSYINCQNPSLSGTPLGADENPRGIYAYNNQSSIAQMTIHTDHPFWDSTVHDAQLHFDQFAALYTGTPGTPTATVEDMTGVDYTHFTDAQGTALPWRNCIGSNFIPPDNGTMHFNNAAGATLANYAAFMTFNQRTQGHLNSDGLCFVKPLE
jgi:hypothetical protein